MCGRFTRFHSWADIHRMDDGGPSQHGGALQHRADRGRLFVADDGEGGLKVRQGRWWLVP